MASLSAVGEKRQRHQRQILTPQKTTSEHVDENRFCADVVELVLGRTQLCAYFHDDQSRDDRRTVFRVPSTAGEKEAPWKVKPTKNPDEKEPSSQRF